MNAVARLDPLLYGTARSAVTDAQPDQFLDFPSISRKRFSTRGPPLRLLLLAIAATTIIGVANAEIRMHRIFDHNMVLQRDTPVKVWGTADPELDISVRFGEQLTRTSTAADGSWEVVLEPMEASSNGSSLLVTGGEDSIELTNVLVGDVWICGGQSNMEFSLEKIYQGDVEIASARHSQIRLMTIPVGATPERLSDFERVNEFNSWTNQHEQKGSWLVCAPETVKRFGSIGYIFGRRLHLASGVPIGLIDNSVGGTTVEGWTSRQSLSKIPEANGLLQDWDERIAAWDTDEDLANRIERWEQDTVRRREQGDKPKPKPDDRRPGPAFDRNNPGASYNAMLKSFAGFKINGVIFHQGYNNALGDSRPNLYAKTFQAMIADWREAFEDDTLPFGIIELCAGAEPQTMDNFEVRMIDAGPYIREAQFKAYRELANMGWASAYDQQVNWYHPQMKVQLAERIARWALATQYEMPFGHAPALLVSSEIIGERIVLTFNAEATVRDGRPMTGMAIAGEDRRFYPADAKFAVARKDDRGREVLDYRKIEVWSPLVQTPKAVRYAWARCPLGNLTNRSHMERILPVPSFRTDDWVFSDAPFGADQSETRRLRNEARKEAESNAIDRKRRVALMLLNESPATEN